MGEKIRRGQLAYWVSYNDAGEAGDPRLLRNSSALESLPYFCTTANLQSAVLYLSQELQGMGLGCPLIDTEGQRVNLVALINALWEVAQLYRSSVRDTSVLQDQRRRDTVDMNHFQSSIKDLRGEVDEKERLVCEAQEKERQAASNNKTLTAKLKAEKEEVRRLTSVLQQREAHHQHELKKKEMENVRLQDRLHRLVAGGKSSESRQASVSLSSTLSRANRSRAKWKTEASSVRHEEELYRRVLGHYEAWIAQVNEENGQLKSSLLRIASLMSKAVEKYSGKVVVVDGPELPDGDMNSSMTSSTFSTDSLDELAVNMEFPAYRDRLQQSFEENMRAIMLLLEEASGASTADSAKTERESESLKEELEDLRRQLKATKEELASHTHAVEKYDAEKTTDKETSFLLEGRNIEEEAWLERERQRLARERELLEEERRTFAEATIRLNRERAAFEAEKGELLKEQFLQDLPATLEADLTFVGQDSCGSLSSGSLGEIFDSPQRVVAVPSITSPTGNITYVPGSSLVLGPTRLSKQQQQDSIMYGSPGSSSSRSAYRFRSAPASRASSIPRQHETREHTPQRGPNNTTTSSNSSIRPPHSRPRTLERLRRKSYSSTSSPVKSRSHSQENLIHGRSRVTNPQRQQDGAVTLPADSHAFRTNIQQHKEFLDCVKRDRLYSDPPSYSRDVSPYINRHSGAPNASHGVTLGAYSQESLLKGTPRSAGASQEDLYSDTLCYSREGSPYSRRHSGSHKGIRSDAYSQENLTEPTSWSYQRESQSQENICDPLNCRMDESVYSKRHSDSHTKAVRSQDSLLDPPSGYQDKGFNPTSESYYTRGESVHSKRHSDLHTKAVRSQDSLLNPPSYQDTVFNPTSGSYTRDESNFRRNSVPNKTAHGNLDSLLDPPSYHDAVFNPTSGSYTESNYSQRHSIPHKATADDASVEMMEADLAELMEQIVGQQKEMEKPTAESARASAPYPMKSATDSAVKFPPADYGRRNSATQQTEKLVAASALQSYLTDSMKLKSATQHQPVSRQGPPPPSPPPPAAAGSSVPMSRAADVPGAKKGRPRMLSLLRTSTGSLFSARRGSVESESGKKGQKGPGKKALN